MIMIVVLGPQVVDEPDIPPNFELGVPAIMPKFVPPWPAALKSPASPATSGAEALATSFDTCWSETGLLFGDVALPEEQAARAATKIAAPIEVVNGVNLKCDIGFRLPG
jgi:hypothetical protein